MPATTVFVDKHSLSANWKYLRFTAPLRRPGPTLTAGWSAAARRARGQVARGDRDCSAAGGSWPEAKQLGHLDPQIEVAQLAVEIRAPGRAANADSVLRCTAETSRPTGTRGYSAASGQR
jgi:hypothetical protein